MKRFLLSAALIAAVTVPAAAHYVFVLPSKDATTVSVVMSDELAVDEEVGIEKIATLKLTCRDSAGKEMPVELKTGKHELTGAIPGSGPRVLFGSVPYGVMTGKDSKSYLLAYHPKAVIGAAAADKVTVGNKLPVELTPVASGSEFAFVLTAGDKPLAEVEVTVIKPDGKSEKVKTDKAGKTTTFPAKGRYGAWARHADAKAGESDGKKYDETRHYATLVVTYDAAK